MANQRPLDCFEHRLISIYVLNTPPVMQQIGKQTKYEDVNVKSYYPAGGSTIASVA